MLALLLLSCDSDYKLTNPADEPEVTIAGESPDIVVSPEAIDFGEVLPGSARSEVVRIENAGEAELLLSEIELVVGAAYSLTATASSVVAPGEHTELTVTLEVPDAELSDWIRIDSNDPDRPTVEVPLSAALPPPPEDTAPPADDEPPFDTPPDTGTAPEPDACECPEGFNPTPAGEICQRRVEEDPIELGEPVDVCAIEPYFAYGMLGVRYPDDTIVQSEYWGQNDSVENGRLNAVGVWACEADSSYAGHDPIGEWIGFSVCLELEEGGDFLVGVGADNRTRVHVDGALIFEEDTGATSAFNYWWMQAVPLTSGLHILTFEGMNDGSIAGMGAEFAGPFDAGTLIDDAAMEDADYAGSLLWSTAEAVGAAFDLGVTSGWVCPDGSTYAACEEEPTCTRIETEPCL